MLLSKEQNYALYKFKKGENLVITGPGGTGKSKLIKHLVDYNLSINRSTQVTALTGCASLLLGLNAKTIHSWSGIRLCKGSNDEIIKKAVNNKKTKKSWKSVHTLIIDEASMMSAKMLHVLNSIGQEIRGNTQPFGNIQVVLTCDFFQLPPVATPSDDESGKFCFECDIYNFIFPWKNHIVLTKVFRQQDQEYIEILNEIRTGEVSDKTVNILKKYVNRPYNKNEYEGMSLTKLYPIRSRVDEINEAMFNEINEETHVFNAEQFVNGIMDLQTKKPIDPERLRLCNGLSNTEKENELQFLINNTPCINKLELKIGATVMCTANIDLSIGICNGSQGMIIGFVNGAPQVRFQNRIIIVMEKHYWASETYPSIYIGQYPLMLAWAITIHKIQGTTLSMAEMDIGQNIFACGQTYVALSRIKSLDGLYLSYFDPKKVKANQKVKDFYAKIPEIPEILENEEKEKINKDLNIKIIKL